MEKLLKLDLEAKVELMLNDTPVLSQHASFSPAGLVSPPIRAADTHVPDAHDPCPAHSFHSARAVFGVLDGGRDYIVRLAGE